MPSESQLHPQQIRVLDAYQRYVFVSLDSHQRVLENGSVCIPLPAAAEASAIQETNRKYTASASNAATAA